MCCLPPQERATALQEEQEQGGGEGEEVSPAKEAMMVSIGVGKLSPRASVAEPPDQPPLSEAQEAAPLQEETTPPEEAGDEAMEFQSQELAPPTGEDTEAPPTTMSAVSSAELPMPLLAPVATPPGDYEDTDAMDISSAPPHMDQPLPQEHMPPPSQEDQPLPPKNMLPPSEVDRSLPLATAPPPVPETVPSEQPLPRVAVPEITSPLLTNESQKVTGQELSLVPPTIPQFAPPPHIPQFAPPPHIPQFAPPPQEAAPPPKQATMLPTTTRNISPPSLMSQPLPLMMTAPMSIPKVVDIQPMVSSDYYSASDNGISGGTREGETSTDSAVGGWPRTMPHPPRSRVRKQEGGFNKSTEVEVSDMRELEMYFSCGWTRVEFLS